MKSLPLLLYLKTPTKRFIHELLARIPLMAPMQRHKAQYLYLNGYTLKGILNWKCCMKVAQEAALNAEYCFLMAGHKAAVL